ncbi:Cmx/CmrA family chloramphenicol efflux MFS transporter [Cellulosimicrobium sp. SL-1]|uniref:Cmx/CmrA family chloramphenicol efflux MFS transporter n=1 Tax=Cellulosimicrobium sp. SL-1 TaxID=2699423 RepID=UPI0013D47337|nr:Cmx/CmrA family chloramphenicol efflux MFS transporter [Cellulosimicrobium sp. SL-1]
MPRALYLLALAVFAMGTSEFMLAGLVPDIAARLDVPVGTAGLLTSAFAVGMVVGAPVMAASARRLPVRATLLGCVALFALAHVVGAVTPSFAALVAVRVVAAFANAGFLAVALGTAATLVPADRTGRAVAVLLSGTTVAMVAGVPAGALLGAAWGWESTFWAVAVLCLPAALGIARGLPARGPERAALLPVDAPSLRTELAQLVSPPLGLTMVSAALVNTGTFATLTFLAPLVTDVAGLSRWWVPVALVLFGVGSFLGVTAAGRTSDRIPGVVVAVGGVLLLGGWVALAAFAAVPVFCLVLVQGVLGFAVGSTLIAQVLRAASGAPTLGGSFATAALNVGAAVGPAVAAATIATRLGDRGPVWVAVAATALALVTAAILRRVTGPATARAPR